MKKTNMNMMNSFVKANTLGAGANGAMTENGAISYNTIGTALLDQFGKSGSFRGRDIKSVWEEQSLLWAEDSESALKFPFYLRMITRQSNVTGGKKTERVQRGAGARDEAFKRLLWIAKYHPTEFYRNLWILPVVGSWKDLWVLLSFDGASEYLDEEKFFNVIAEGIYDENHRDLVKKYLPRIRSSKKCTTDWAIRTNEAAKRFAKAAGWTYEDYRDFKSTGKAHAFQSIICSGQYSKIDWKTIPGQALLNLVNGKFLDKHGLTENYINWVEQQPNAKFNGYAFDLLRKIKDRPNLSRASMITINKQFDGLIETASKDGGTITGNVLCAIDTSGSMNHSIDDNGTTAYDACVSLGIYFSELNKGAFHNVIAMFDNNSTLKTLSGGFCDKYEQIRKERTAWGGTNFQSLINLIVNTRKSNPEIPIEDFPKTLLVVTDNQFNPSGHYRFNYDGLTEMTNYDTAMAKLREVFPEEFVNEFKIIWWYCTNRDTKDVPSTMEHAGTYHFSGFDGAVVSFLLGGEVTQKVQNKEASMPTMEEIISTAFSQEVLSLVR